MSTAIERFRRAMRRYDIRARRARLDSTSITFLSWRDCPPSEAWAQRCAEYARRGPVGGIYDDPRQWRTSAFLFERAADAVARLRAEQETEARP